MMRRLPWLAVAPLFALLALAVGPAATGQQIERNPFEGRHPTWKAGRADAPAKVLEHRMSDDHAHGGQRAEMIRLQVEKGSYLHYTLDVPKAPVNDELSVSLWVKANRPGIQLLARIVLPRERDPNNAGQPLAVFVRCEPYQGTLWKPLTLNQPVKRLKEQQRLLTHQLGREVATAGAYVDQLVLNLYDGPGLVEVWIDDLEIGPVEEAKGGVLPPPVARSEAGNQAVSRRATEVLLRGNQLWVGGNRFFLRGIRHTGSPPLRTIRDAGFNTVWLDESTPPGLLDDAVAQGLWVVPTIAPPRLNAGPGGVEGMLTSREEFGQKVSRFKEHEAVLAWDLGSNLGSERFLQTSQVARQFRALDAHRPVIADVWDGYRGYSRSVDQLLLGTHRWPLLTSLELPAYREWLDSRRRLAADPYCWTWVQTHLPEWFVRLNEADKDGFKEPLGPHPEQIRLLAYTALAAGFKGLAFWSDRSLADSHQGKDRLLAMALLNQEFTLLERILVTATGDPDWISTSRPEVMAAVFHTTEGVLVLPIWVGPGSQYVPGQAASAELTITVPGVPTTATAWEVSPGRIQTYPFRRELGGCQVKLRNFSLTSALVFTSNLGPKGLVVWLQNKQRTMGPLAAQWLLEQAREELAKVETVQAELERTGHAITDAAALLDRARKAIELSTQLRRNHEHGEAFAQAEVALRAVRVLMRASWEKAVRDLDAPVSSPFAVSFYTLPRHWKMLGQMKPLQPAASVLPGGDFEAAAETEQQGWMVQEVPTLDDVAVRVRRVTGVAHDGQQCLMMQVAAKDPKREPAALERTYVALHSPAVRLEPGTLVSISGWVKIPAALKGSADGALLFDSAGGEPLALRLVGETAKWKKYTLYRRVPASGQISVTVALSALGTVYFDDLRIQPLVPAATSGATPPAVRGSSR